MILFDSEYCQCANEELSQGGGYAWQKKYNRAETTPKTYVKDDWTTNGYVGPMFLYMFYGFYDGTFPRFLC